MTRSNKGNLIKFSSDPHLINSNNARDATKAGKKGGKASGIARAKKKSMKEDLQYLLNLMIDSNKAFFDPEEVKELAALEHINISAQLAMLLAQLMKAIAGDTRSAEFIRDTVGEKPTTNIEATAEHILIDESYKKMKEYFESKGE